MQETAITITAYFVSLHQHNKLSRQEDTGQKSSHFCLSRAVKGFHNCNSLPVMSLRNMQQMTSRRAHTNTIVYLHCDIAQHSANMTYNVARAAKQEVSWALVIAQGNFVCHKS